MFVIAHGWMIQSFLSFLVRHFCPLIETGWAAEGDGLAVPVDLEIGNNRIPHNGADRIDWPAAADGTRGQEQEHSSQVRQ